jgi:hypothetical protein
MALSSVFVLTNALRLKRFTPLQRLDDMAFTSWGTNPLAGTDHRGRFRSTSLY